ncbi:MAG: type II secretion system protein GspJ [Planctomycetaceae bacterium]|nr:prepilin-type N-terminal cleavage/methylation domain-containing protein [Planctomycetaceae bacterium]
MTAARRDRSGFTLLELMAASTLTILVAAALFTCLGVALKARRSAEGATQTIRKLTAAMDLIVADLQSARVPDGRLAESFTGAGDSEGIISSGLDSVTFYAAATDIAPAPGIGDVKKIEYACDLPPGSSSAVLTRYITTNLLAETEVLPREEVICREVKSLLLRYHDGAAWQTSWVSSEMGNLLPKAVEITLELEGAQTDPTRRLTRTVLLPCGREQPLAAASGGAP